MAWMVAKDSIFGEGDSYSFRLAIRLGRVERVSKFVEERYSTVDLGGLLHYALSYNEIEVVQLLLTKFKCPVDCTNESQETPLHIACKTGDLNVVRMLVADYKANLLAHDENNDTPLSKAVSNGHDSVVSCLIDEFKSSPNVKGFNGWSLLHHACNSGHKELAEKLVTHYNLSPLAIGDNGNTCLHIAAFNGSEEMLKLFIAQYKCPVNIKNDSNDTPLHYACKQGHIVAVRILISQYNADMNALNSDNYTPLGEAAIYGHTEIVKCLVDEFNCNPKQAFEGRTILHMACAVGHIKLAEYSLAHYDLDPTSATEKGDTPLHFAAMFGGQEMLNLLITKHKCPVDCKNSNNETPLHYACQKGNLNAVRILISQHNADLNAHSIDKSTPLTQAASNGHTNVVKCLIDEFGCSPNITYYGNKTILHCACSEGHMELVETLLTRYSLDPLLISDDDGETPIHVAALYGQQELVNLLITKYNCPVDCGNGDNETLLHKACSGGHCDLVKMLVSEHKADVSKRDDYYKRTPLSLAVLHGHSSVVKCLIDEYNTDIKEGEATKILHDACSKGHVELAKTMITHYNLDPSSVDEYGNIPLHTAALYGKKEVVKLLISKFNCPVDRRNNSNQTPLHYACSRGDLGVVTMLISEYKADLYARDKDKNTPIMAAALKGNTEVVKCLIDEFGYDPNIKGYDGRTLLHQACISGSVDLAESLITCYNLDPLSVDSSGNTCLHTAAMGKYVRVVNLLVTKYKCSVDCRNNNGQTPLHIACCKNSLAARKLMSVYKADVKARDKQNNTPLHMAAMGGCATTINRLIKEFGCNANTKGFEGRTILHIVCSEVQYAPLAKKLMTNYDLDPMADDNGNTPLHLAVLKGNEEVVNLLITKCKCPIDSRNKKNESPLDLALASDHQNIVNFLKREIEKINASSLDKDCSHLLPIIPREGYICAVQSSVCIVQMPSDRPISVAVESVDDITLHPKLLAKEFLLTPIVRISSDTKVFNPDKQAVIELLKVTELHGSENKPIPMFSNTHPSQPPRWQDLNPDDFEVVQDRIVFNTTHFSLFTVIARLPTPTNSIKVTPNKKHQEPVELTLSEVPNVKVVIPPSSIKTESETEVKITANFDHPLLCEESIDATACITLEPHGLQFKERVPIKIPIPDYAQITEMYSNAKLQFLHSNDPLDSEAINWSVIPEGEYEIVKEGNEYMGIVYFTHFSNRKAVWLNIPKKIKKAIQGPIHEFRKCIAKKFLKTFSGRCQVFMSSETVIGNLLNFSIAALLHPLQEFHEIPKNYNYMLYDSEKTPMTIKGSILKLTIELAEYCSSSEMKKFSEEVELSGDFSARADFNIALDSSTLIVDGAVLGKLSIEHGEVKAHKMNLIKPKKAPIMKHITKKMSKEDVTTSSVLESNSGGEGQKALAKEPEIIVYLPSLDSTAVLKPKDIRAVHEHLWPARHKWRRIGMAVEIDATTLEVIEMDNRRTDDCYFEMLTKWLRSNKPSPCWKSLTAALQSIEIRVLLEPTVHSSQKSVAQSGSPVHPHKKKPPVPSPRKRALVPLPRKKAPTPIPRKKPPLPPKKKSLTAKQAIAVAVRQLNTSLNQWESNVVTEMAKKIANCTEQMAVHVRDDCQVTEKFRGDFATLAGSIVCESEKLITLGDEVAEACTEKTLKKALQQENLPKIEPICKQFKLLMKVMEPSHEEQGDAILVDNAENLLSAVKKVVEDIQVATIEIKDHSVQERLGLKWVKRDVHTVKKFGPVFIPKI